MPRSGVDGREALVQVVPRSAFALALLAAFVAGCSSDVGDAGTGGEGGRGGEGGQGGEGGLGGHFTSLAQPCENFSTPYPGDEYCIAPPPPGEGIQVHYGPAAYDEETARPFVIGPGQETVDVQYVDSTNDEEILFNRYAGRLRPGTHHLIVAQSPNDKPDTLETEEDFPPVFEGFDILFGSQTRNFDVPAPGEPLSKDEEGLAFTFGARRQLALNAHFINTGQTPLLREAWFNVWKAKREEVTTIAAPIFLIAGTTMAIQPGQHVTWKAAAVVPRNLRVHLLFGHYHSHTIRFTAWAVRNGVRDLVYEAYDYQDPPNMRYNGAVKNALPDKGNQIPGGYSGILEVSEGDSLEWECEVVNNDNFVLRFANEVKTGEMCNLFGFYSPTMGSTWFQALD